MCFSHTSPFTARTLVSERVEQGEQRFRLREAGAVSWVRGLCTATHEGQRAVSVRLGSYSGWVFLEGQVPQRSSGR